MRAFSIWIDHQEQWDASDIDPPNMTVEAKTVQEAAEKFAEDRCYDESEANVIIRDEETKKYWHVKLVRKWDVDEYFSTSLEELCKP